MTCVCVEGEEDEEDSFSPSEEDEPPLPPGGGGGGAVILGAIQKFLHPDRFCLWVRRNSVYLLHNLTLVVPVASKL